MTSRQHSLDSHPSLSASMDDFEPREFSPTMPDLPSQHSGFRSNGNSEYSEMSSRRSHSPPAWRKAGSGWFKQHPALSHNRAGFRSQESSPQHHLQTDPDGDADGDRDDGDWTAYRTARCVPLPESPIKGRSPGTTPEPTKAGGAAEGDNSRRTATTSTLRRVSEETQRPEPDEEVPRIERSRQNNCKCITDEPARSCIRSTPRDEGVF